YAGESGGGIFALAGVVAARLPFREAALTFVHELCLTHHHATDRLFETDVLGRNREEQRAVRRRVEPVGVVDSGTEVIVSFVREAALLLANGDAAHVRMHGASGESTVRDVLVVARAVRLTRA